MVGDFLTSLGTIIFQKTSLLRGVNSKMYSTLIKLTFVTIFIYLFIIITQPNIIYLFLVYLTTLSQ
jgi:hypothetical protein